MGLRSRENGSCVGASCRRRRGRSAIGGLSGCNSSDSRIVCCRLRGAAVISGISRGVNSGRDCCSGIRLSSSTRGGGLGS